jgi:hypothetical protein
MFVRASCLLVLHCLHRHLVVLTGKCSPLLVDARRQVPRWRPARFLWEILVCPSFFSRGRLWAAQREQAGTTVGHVDHVITVLLLKTIHNRKVNEKVKQTVPPSDWVPPNCISFSSIVEAIYSCTLHLRWGKEQSMMYRLCSFVSPKWHAWDCDTWTGLS